MKLRLTLVACGLLVLPIGCGDAGDAERGLETGEPSASETSDGVTVDACFYRTIGNPNECQSKESLYEQGAELCKSQGLLLLDIVPDESCNAAGSHSAQITCCHPPPPPPPSSCTTTIEDVNCATAAALEQYALDKCQDAGLSLGAHVVGQPCPGGFTGVKYSCCED